MRTITLHIGVSKRCMNRMCCRKYSYDNRLIKERIGDS